MYRGAAATRASARATGDNKRGGGTSALWVPPAEAQWEWDRAPLKLAAEAAPWVAAMRAPRAVRVVWFEERSAARGRPRNLVRDCLTGDLRALAMEAEWTATGTALSGPEKRKIERAYPPRNDISFREIKQLRGW